MSVDERLAALHGVLRENYAPLRRPRPPSVYGRIRSPVAVPAGDGSQPDAPARHAADIFVNGVAPAMDGEGAGVLARVLRTVGMSAAYGWARALGAINGARVEGGVHLSTAVTSRLPGQGLVTVSNHTSTVDDPVNLSLMLPRAQALQRWAPCASDVCFKNDAAAWLSYAVQALPLRRGAGLQQPELARLARLVAAGGWVHVYPEARVVFEPQYAGCDGPVPTHRGPPAPAEMRWGAAKLATDAAIAAVRAGEAERAPLLLPLAHRGMAALMPGSSGHPRPREAPPVVLRAGPPVPYVDVAAGYVAHERAYAAGLVSEPASVEACYARVTARASAAVRELYADTGARLVDPDAGGYRYQRPYSPADDEEAAGPRCDAFAPWRWLEADRERWRAQHAETQRSGGRDAVMRELTEIEAAMQRLLALQPE